MVKFALLFCLAFSVHAADFRGRQFISLDSFETGSEGVRIFDSVVPEIEWDELVPSWNFRATNSGLSIEVQVGYPDYETKWYHLGRWSLDPSRHPRESVPNQRDEHGTVHTDTLKMNRPGGQVRVRVTTSLPNTKVDFLGLSFADSRAAPAPLPANTNAWGKILTVEERTQADFPEGISEWCSPTATSMLLSFWAAQLDRPELNRSVPDVAAAVNDPSWPGTGNWPFNTAFAGSFPGLRAYVARFSDVSEMEEWIAAGIPLAFSVSYSLLKGQTEPGNGHLVVCIGFTENGDVIVNDPGRRQVRQTYRRGNLVKAWAASKNTVYLIHPEDARVPKDRFGHWSKK